VFAFNYQQTHVWRAAVDTGVETRITSGDFSVLDYQLSRDGRKIAHHRAPNPLLGYADQGEIWVMDADGSHPVQLTKNDIPENGASLSPDGSQLLFLAAANERFDKYYNRKVFVMPAGGGPHKVVSPADVPYEIERAIWSKDGKSIYFLANMGIHAELFVMPAGGGPPKQLTDGPHSIGGWSMEGDRHAFTVDEATNPGDVWALAPAHPRRRASPHVFDYLANEFDLPARRRIQWKGRPCYGRRAAVLPSRVTSRASAATRFRGANTAGGPQASAIGSIWLVGDLPASPRAKGCRAVRAELPRQARATATRSCATWWITFQNSHLDVMAGVDEVIRRGIADPDRMVKSGWSGGGHMTNKIITFTDRFKAAASGAGAANWVSMYAQSDTRTQRTPWFGGTPWQKNAPIDLYWSNSPLKDVANVKTPTIFFVGQQDPRVPMPQSVEMYRALKSNGVPTQLYVAPREPHVWEELRHELFKMNAELEWFEKYATKRPYTWEKAPDDKSEPKTTSQQPEGRNMSKRPSMPAVSAYWEG
jgi:dienelactone hydrolase